MFKIVLFGSIIWFIVFSLRIISMGGLDPTYRDNENELLKPARQYLSQTLDRILPYPQSALLAGILIGSQENLPLSLKESLKATSTIHLVVVSGQNLSMLAGFIMSLVYWLGRKRTIIVTACVILLYSLLTGLQVPVIRAAMMVGAGYIAQIIGREKTSWWVLAIVGGTMLLYNPNWLLSISFQLSFLATVGVVVVAPVVLPYLTAIPKVLKEDLAITLSAQVLVMPVIAFNFGQISLIGIVVNSLILWSIPFLMVSGFISLAVGLINGLIGQAVGLFPGVLLTYFIYLVELFAKIPLSAVDIGKTGVILWMGYYLIIGAGIWMLKIKSDKL